MKRALYAAIASIVVGFATTANAATVEQALLACKQEENALKRLVCFDNVASAISNNEAPVAEFKTSPSSSSASPVVRAPQSAEDKFGLEHKREREKELDSIVSEVVAISESKRGDITITLKNGSKWRQVESSSLRIKKGSKVEIKRGVLGAFYLGVQGLSRQMKVKRID